VEGFVNHFQDHLKIADVVFSPLYDGEMNIEGYEDAIYKPFAFKELPEGASFYTDVNIACGVDDAIVRDIRGWSPLFKGDPCWELLESKGNLQFLFYSQNGGQPDLTATCRRNFRQVDIQCGPSYLMRDRSPARLSNPLRYPLDQLLMIHILARQGGVLLHTAGVSYNGHAYLFAGSSGAGKSTIAGLLGGAPGIEAINDDRIVVRKKEGSGYRVYGTPWPGEKRISRNLGLPLGGIFFIAKSGEGNKIRPLSAAEALKSMFPVREMAAGVMDFCGGLVRDVGMYEFAFRPDESAADCFLTHACDHGRPN
jgi:hypothetical protein